MLIPLAEAALRLGITVRQARYAVKKGTLRAQKIANTWLVDEATLPAPADPRQAMEQEAELRQAVDQALAPPANRGIPFSVSTIRAFNEVIGAVKQAGVSLRPDHPALAALQECALALSRGTHAFRSRAKGESYEAAREHAAEAVAWLYLYDEPGARAVADRVEAGAMPAIGGLVRRSEGGRGR